MKRKVKMTKRIAWQIQRYIDMSVAIQSLADISTTISIHTSYLACVSVRSSRRTPVTGAKRRIMDEVKLIKKEIADLKLKRSRYLSNDVRLAIQYAISQRYAHNSFVMTEMQIVSRNLNDIALALHIPVGTLLGNDKTKANS